MYRMLAADRKIDEQQQRTDASLSFFRYSGASRHRFVSVVFANGPKTGNVIECNRVPEFPILHILNSTHTKHSCITNFLAFSIRIQISLLTRQ